MAGRRGELLELFLKKAVDVGVGLLELVPAAGDLLDAVSRDSLVVILLGIGEVRDVAAPRAAKLRASPNSVDISAQGLTGGRWMRPPAFLR